MKVSPCKDCLDRTLTCHSVCRRYEDWKIENAARQDWLREQNSVEISDSVIRRNWKRKRYCRQQKSKINIENRR